ncbi:hypothetical protein [Kitasatospora sp. NPDC094015]|uniref:hypothetical protein n=1 Tax=Kitasatospora sp. NPDC094015 TaxID=3155205 RepID=UPI003324A48E
MLLLGLLLMAAAGAFTGLLIADNLSGGPEYQVAVLGQDLTTTNTLEAFLAGAALALIFGFGLLLLIMAAGRSRRRRRTATAATRRAAGPGTAAVNDVNDMNDLDDLDAVDHGAAPAGEASDLGADKEPARRWHLPSRQRLSH